MAGDSKGTANPTACKITQHRASGSWPGARLVRPTRKGTMRVDRLSASATAGLEKWSPPSAGPATETAEGTELGLTAHHALIVGPPRRAHDLFPASPACASVRSFGAGAFGRTAAFPGRGTLVSDTMADWAHGAIPDWRAGPVHLPAPADHRPRATQARSPVFNRFVQLPSHQPADTIACSTHRSLS